MEKINLVMATFARTFNLSSPKETEPGSKNEGKGEKEKVR